MAYDGVQMAYYIEDDREKGDGKIQDMNFTSFFAQIGISKPFELGC
jgi:hypothetical protein|tara:strand:+ start:101 stop:238 length:138 start_codon:yes stop_codon:yes gene_type:complete